MRKLVLTTLSMMTLASLILVGCAPAAPEVVVETVEVPVKETVEVEVEVPVEVEVTAVPEEPTEVAYERSETIYVSGAAWGPPSTWNPFQPGSLANTTGTIGNVYEFLFHFDPLTGEFIPWLAESGGWTDDTTYDLTLRPGLT